MYTSRGTSILKIFIYAIVILLALCSIMTAVGFVFADKLPQFPLADVSKYLCYIATVLLFVHITNFVFVIIFQIRKLYNYLGYVILSFVAIISYIAAWFTTPSLFHYILSLFGK